MHTDMPHHRCPPSLPSLCVLGSGSGGNCSIVTHGSGPGRVTGLIDLGFSPRRTRGLLSLRGLTWSDVSFVVLTHLDSDHWREAWSSALPAHVELYALAGHARALAGLFGAPARVRPVRRAFEPAPGIRVEAIHLPHDELGVGAFRFEFAGAGCLGFATDVGRPDAGMLEHFRGVDVMALESNYCPRMQEASSRPAFLKRRIMGGHGHLSNEQAAEALRRIEPREHAVLLHLSRECNRPEVVARLHDGADYAVTITSQDEPSRWVSIGASRARPVTRGRGLAAGLTRS